MIALHLIWQIEEENEVESEIEKESEKSKDDEKESKEDSKEEIESEKENEFEKEREEDDKHGEKEQDKEQEIKEEKEKIENEIEKESEIQEKEDTSEKKDEIEKEDISEKEREKDSESTSEKEKEKEDTSENEKEKHSEDTSEKEYEKENEDTSEKEKEKDSEEESEHESRSCDSDNYIIVYYGKDVQYNSNFINKYRNNIDFIIYDNSKVSTTDILNIKAGSKIEIHFSSYITSLESFFDKNYDGNVINIESIDLSHFCSYFVTNMSYLFSGCNTLKSINFTNFDTSLVVDMSRMFYNCRALKLSNLFNFNTSKVTNMSYMFYNCRALESLNLTNFDTSSLLNIDSMFRNSNSLITIDAKTWDLGKVTTMAYLFSGCSKLRNLYYMSTFNSPSVINKVGMYNGCSSLFSPDNPDFQSSYNESDPINIVLLAFSKYKIISKIITFNIFFYSYEYFEFPELLYLSASIIYNSRLRLLQEENNVECIKEEMDLNDKEKYGCTIDIENSDIKAIILNDSFDFGTENSLIISPLASEYMQNLQNIKNIPESFDDYLNEAKIFTLRASKLEQKGKIFNVSGEMDDDPLLPIGKEITLMANYENEETNSEINCTVTDNDTTKYTLNCDLINNTNTYDLNHSMSMMDSDILMIYLEDGINITNKSDIIKSNRKYYSKSSSGVSSGAIVAIILSPIIALASVIAIIYYSKKNNIKRPTPGNESSSVGINLNKHIY